MARDPYIRFLQRLVEIHATEAAVCIKCNDPAPCDTMRSLWIYDLERGR